MKNREKFAKEILDIACKGGRLAVIKGNKVTDCDNINCEQCLFSKFDIFARRCDDEALIQWAESEYVEKPTITSREKNFLDALLPNFKYIARDSNDRLCIYYNKPKRNSMDNYWIPDDDYYYYVSSNMYGSMFNFIKWEDKEPWSIEDLKKLEVKKDD